MNFPFNLEGLEETKISNFQNYYAKNKRFVFEGLWFRGQEEINKELSGWENENSKKRRVIHFRHTFDVANKTLRLYSSYLYLNTRLEKQEMTLYLTKIKEALKKENYKLKEKFYEKDDLQISLNLKEDIDTSYETLDIIVKSKNVKNTKTYYKQVWELYQKGIRPKEKRENPTYIKSLEEIKDLWPAQVELGCGPSIDASIDPLYSLHEIYKVQRHKDSKFYFGKGDTIAYDIIKNPAKMYKLFSQIILKCIKAKPTRFYLNLKKMYDQKLLIGPLFNNNFDHLASVCGINEKHLRVYNIHKYFPKIKFNKKAKSLICIGTHADRRYIQKQARMQGLKIIYIDPEGFNTKKGFEPYLIEGPKDEDYILNATSKELAKILESYL